MYLTILILPLIGSILSGFFGKKIGVTGSHVVTISCLFISSILSSIAFYEVIFCDSPVYIFITSWVDSEILNISWEFLFDSLSVAMLIPVLFISTLVHLFSVDYMAGDPAKQTGNLLLWEKLSNSGNLLKLLIPSYIWKYISGQNNYLGMVTSQKMSENEMGYRGSKSKFLIQIPQPNKFKFFVKEQRVDGSCFGFLKYNKSPKLRCTLMGSERNYQVMIPSKQLNIKSFSTLNIKPELDPWFITGLIDAEGSFSILIIKDIRRTLGWRVECKFQLGLHKRDLPLLLEILKYFSGIGSIYSSTTSNLVNYSIHSNKQLLTLINHFNKYPLITQAPKGVEQIIYYLKK